MWLSWRRYVIDGGIEVSKAYTILILSLSLSLSHGYYLNM